MTRALDAGLLEAVSRSVEAQLGLHYPPERWADLERGLRGAAAELGFGSVEECARALTLARLARPQIEALAAQLTIGETYFFRDPAVFTALAAEVFPALVREREGRAKTLRIWSAGCCTGEEPYSVAIALRTAIPDIDDWQVTILATDINPRFLHKAVAGVYGPWSFRGVPEETRGAWFRQTGKAQYEILPRIRKMVSFAALNLVEDVSPSLATNTNAMDLIFCRNVLMYFSRPQLRRVVGNFQRSLVEGGRLVVSATEAARELFEGFTPGTLPGVGLYRKVAREPAPALVAPPPIPWPMPPPVEKVEPAAPVDHAAEARRLANEGRLPEALAACDRALAADKLVAAHHYLRGVILQEQNAPADAIAALRRALYLDADFVLAHFTLGHLLLREGRTADARRCFANARALLRPRAPEGVLPEAEGMTAGRLLAILESMEESLA